MVAANLSMSLPSLDLVVSFESKKFEHNTGVYDTCRRQNLKICPRTYLRN